MKNFHKMDENFTDIKNLGDDTLPIFPGVYAPLDLSLFYPGGMIM